MGDHRIIAVSYNLPQSHHFTKTSFMARPMTESGQGKFRELILRENWATFCSEESPTGAVNALNKTLLLMLDTALPKKKYTRKSTDDYWDHGAAHDCPVPQV